MHSKPTRLIEYINNEHCEDLFATKPMLNAHLPQGKYILIANMLKIGHLEETDFFLLVYKFLSRSFQDQMCILGKTNISLTKYSNSYWFLCKTGQNNLKSHSSTIKVPLALHSYMRLTTLGIKQVRRANPVVHLAPILN